MVQTETDQQTDSFFKNKGLVIVYLIVLVDMIGYGLILPVMPKLITSITGETVSNAAVHGGQFMYIFAIAMFIFSPILGGLSDQFGRRRILLLSLVGQVIDYLFMAVAPTLGLIFIGRIVAGIMAAGYATANAYVADVSSQRNKARNFGILASSFGVGFTIGPAIGGLVSEQFGVRAPFYLAALLCLINFVAGYWFLPESLVKEKRREFSWRRANPVGNLIVFSKYKSVLLFALIWFLVQFGHNVLPAIWPYFVSEKFGWGESQIGWSLFVVGVCFAFVQGVLTGPLIAKLGYYRGALTGISIFCLALICYAFLTKAWMVYVVIIVGALGNIYGPAFQAIITSLVPKDAQGELQGGLSSLTSLTLIFSPLIMTHIFRAFSGPNAAIYFPGAPFLAAFCVVFVAAVMIALQRKAIQSAQNSS